MKRGRFVEEMDGLVPHTPSLLNLARDWNIPKEIRKKIISYLGPVELSLVLLSHWSRVSYDQTFSTGFLDGYRSWLDVIGEYAAYHGYTGLIEWTLKGHRGGSKTRERLSWFAGGGGSVETLQFLSRTGLVLQSSQALRAASAEGRLSVMQWFTKEFMFSNMLNKWLMPAYQKGHDHILDWARTTFESFDFELFKSEFWMTYAADKIYFCDKLGAPDRIVRRAGSPTASKRMLDLEYDRYIHDLAHRSNLFFVSRYDDDLYCHVTKTRIPIRMSEHEAEFWHLETVCVSSSYWQCLSEGQREVYRKGLDRTYGRENWGVVQTSGKRDSKVKTCIRICEITPAEELEYQIPELANSVLSRTILEGGWKRIKL